MQPTTNTIPFEDRTSETPEQAADRVALGPAVALANAAGEMAEGDEALALRAMSIALGLAATEAGVPIAALLDLVASQKLFAERALEEHEVRMSRHADA